jgi:ABC-type antimicrobial peptide transport system permease subunit
MVIGEGLLLATLGVILASVLGLGLGVLWVKATFPALLGWTLSLHVPLAQTGELALTALGISLLAAYLPTRRVVRLDPIAALRAE